MGRLSIDEAYKIVMENYQDKGLADKWRAKFPENPGEITYSQAYDALDDVLSGGILIRPSFGRTNSKSDDGHFEFPHDSS